MRPVRRATHVYRPPALPKPTGERARRTLWLRSGAAPAGGRQVEIVVVPFVFTA